MNEETKATNDDSNPQSDLLSLPNQHEEDVKEELQTDETATATKANVIAQLRSVGVVAVEVHYDGCGDNGFIEWITATKGDKTEADLDNSLTGVIEEYVCENLPDGWEIDAGSFGTVVIDVVKETIAFEHYERYTEIELSEWEE